MLAHGHDCRLVGRELVFAKVPGPLCFSPAREVSCLRPSFVRRFSCSEKREEDNEIFLYPLCPIKTAKIKKQEDYRFQEEKSQQTN